MMVRHAEENEDNGVGDGCENDFSLEFSDEVAPLLSDAERFWGASAAPEMVVEAIENLVAEFIEGLLEGKLLDIELVRARQREREGERERERKEKERTATATAMNILN